MKKNNIKNKFFKSTIKIVGNKGLSKKFLGKAIKNYLVQNSKTNEIIVNGYRMLLDEDDVMQMSLFDYDPIETKIVRTHVKKKDITVDIGANMGYYTLLMAKQGAEVFSYEPEPKNFELLKKKIALNDFSLNVKLYNKAVSDFNGNSKLILAAKPEYGAGKHKLDTNRFGKESIDVEVTKIELDKIDFAKIDVEGTELHVLRGMKSLPNKMLIEFNAKNLKESGSDYKDFFNFIEKYKIKQISKTGLDELDYDELLNLNDLAANLFLY
ncbi:MAG: hypothetical protein CM1200mP23_4100 [Nitrososphaerota archaeon]|nr:MAG: hypothetical protein CM1200mP23_4100 [Nitrososphaerota archaeon]